MDLRPRSCADLSRCQRQMAHRLLPPPPRRDGESRPAFRGGASRPQGDRPFKRPYASAGDRPPRRGPAAGFARPASGDRPERKFTPRPRPEGSVPAARPEGGEREPRPFRATGQRPNRPGGFSKSAGRVGGFQKPSFRKPAFGKPSFGKPGGFRKPPSDRPAAGGDGSDRPRPPRPAFDSAERSRPAGRDAASGPRKPGGFRKPGAPGKSFGKPRPAGAGYGKPRPAGAGKNRTSTTTSSGKPRRPGGFGKTGPGASGRPPAKGSFGDFKPRAKPSAGKRADPKRPGAKRPGGLGAPKRKPRSEGDEG